MSCPQDEADHLAHHRAAKSSRLCWFRILASENSSACRAHRIFRKNCTSWESNHAVDIAVRYRIEESYLSHFTKTCVFTQPRSTARISPRRGGRPCRQIDPKPDVNRKSPRCWQGRPTGTVTGPNLPWLPHSLSPPTAMHERERSRTSASTMRGDNYPFMEITRPPASRSRGIR